MSFFSHYSAPASTEVKARGYTINNNTCWLTCAGSTAFTMSAGFPVCVRVRCSVFLSLNEWKKRIHKRKHTGGRARTTKQHRRRCHLKTNPSSTAASSRARNETAPRLLREHRAIAAYLLLCRVCNERKKTKQNKQTRKEGRKGASRQQTIQHKPVFE